MSIWKQADEVPKVGIKYLVECTSPDYYDFAYYDYVVIDLIKYSGWYNMNNQKLHNVVRFCDPTDLDEVKIVERFLVRWEKLENIALGKLLEQGSKLSEEECTNAKEDALQQAINDLRQSSEAT